MNTNHVAPAATWKCRAIFCQHSQKNSQWCILTEMSAGK